MDYQVNELRQILIEALSDEINRRELKQEAAAELLGVSQARISAIHNGRIEDFRLDRLVKFANQLDLRVTMSVT
jgi:predicted XRE-type DNA-binding protein